MPSDISHMNLEPTADWNAITVISEKPLIYTIARNDKFEERMTRFHLQTTILRTWIVGGGRPLSVPFLFRASGKGTDKATMLRLEKYGRIKFSL